MRKVRAALITSALAAAMLIAPTIAANAAPGTKVNGDVIVTYNGQTYRLNIGASGGGGKGTSGGFLLTSTAGGKKAQLVGGKIKCFTLNDDGSVFLVGEVTNDEGTPFGDSNDATASFILFAIDDNGATGDLVTLQPTEVGTCLNPSFMATTPITGSITIS